MDDVVISGRSELLVDAFVTKFRKTYETTEPETANWILGIAMESKPGEVTLSQPSYVRKMVRSWGMEMARTVKTPLPSSGTLSRTDTQPSREELMRNRTFVGSLLYLAQSTRPDLSNAVCQLAHVMTAPPAEWNNVVKHVMKYLSGTENLGIRYGGPVTHFPFSPIPKGKGTPGGKTSALWEKTRIPNPNLKKTKKRKVESSWRHSHLPTWFVRNHSESWA